MQAALSLNAYFDESGTHADSAAVAVAGYVSTPEQWRAFSGDWSAALADWEVDHFHMKEFVHRRGAYATWSDAERHTRFAYLADLIQKHVLASVGIVIPNREFNELFSASAQKYAGGAYGVAAMACFLDTANLLKDDFPSAKLSYTFEAGCKGSGQIRKVFQENLKNSAQRSALKLFSLTFEGKESPPLQAADVLAYELHKHLPRQTGLDSRPIRREHMTMLARIERRRWGYLEADEMRRWSQVLEISTKIRSIG